MIASCALRVTEARATTAGASPAQTIGRAPDPGTLSELAALGKRIFHDPSLSGSGRLSCASCHDPQHAYAPPNALAVQWGGLRLDRQGLRAVPSLRYVLPRTPIWSRPYVASRAERLIEGEEPPAGGFGWDGRFDTLHEQAAFPLLAANEMAGGSERQVAARLRTAPYARDFRRLFGARVFADPVGVFRLALQALERFELEDPSFHPYSSRYDDFLEGKASLTDQELRGRRLYDDPRKGNCATCHPDRKGADGSHPLFTDYQFAALGVPRNPELRMNGDPHFHDYGLCGPLRTDQTREVQYCGLFKTPTLRNVATRGAFFHNGRFHTLADALRFYARRDTDPQLWYPIDSAGRTAAFDDLAPEYRVNVDRKDVPLMHTRGDTPDLDEGELSDLLAFLGTLTDRDVAAGAPSVTRIHPP